MSLPGRLGRYEILTLIGRGAMGAVYKARDPAIDRLVAVKTVGGGLVSWADNQDEFIERFRREARAAGRLTHPHIVSVYDLGVEEATETPFIVMEYVAGVSLATLLKENPLLPVEQALEIVEQIASALDEAHHKGVVHRDIKPANIFLDQRGRVKVGDFGIARLEGSDLTQPGVGLGTPGYLAPELLQGAAADARTDLYALGVVAYQLLTGRKPFERGKGEGTEPPGREVVPPHVLRLAVPEAASLAVMRCLAPDPGDRPENAAALIGELRAGAARAETSSPTVTVRVPTAPSRRRRRAVLLGAGLLLLAGLGGLAFVWGRGDPRASASPAPVPPAEPSRRVTPRPSPLATRPSLAPSPTLPPQIKLPDVFPEKEGRAPSPQARADRQGEDPPRRGPKDKPERGQGKGRGKGNKKKED